MCHLLICYLSTYHPNLSPASPNATPRHAKRIKAGTLVHVVPTSPTSTRRHAHAHAHAPSPTPRHATGDLSNPLKKITKNERKSQRRKNERRRRWPRVRVCKITMRGERGAAGIFVTEIKEKKKNKKEKENEKSGGWKKPVGQEITIPTGCLGRGSNVDIYSES